MRIVRKHPIVIREYGIGFKIPTACKGVLDKIESADDATADDVWVLDADVTSVDPLATDEASRHWSYGWFVYQGTIDSAGSVITTIKNSLSFVEIRPWVATPRHTRRHDGTPWERIFIRDYAEVIE